MPALEQVLDDDGVLWLTLNRPERLNALDAAMRESLIESLRTTHTTNARCVVITGAGKGFCSGADLKEMDPRRGISVYERMRVSTQELTRSVMECPVPVVASVHGACAGSGLSIALSADLCVAADTARLIASFAARSVVPDGGIGWLLPRLVGMAIAKRWLLLGEELSGEDAAAIGAIAFSVAAAERETHTTQLARRLASMPTKAVSFTKALLNETTASDFNSFLLQERSGAAMISLTRDAGEGVAAFREGRKPNYTNE